MGQITVHPFRSIKPRRVQTNGRDHGGFQSHGREERKVPPKHPKALYWKREDGYVIYPENSGPRVYLTVARPLTNEVATVRDNLALRPNVASPEAKVFRLTLIYRAVDTDAALVALEAFAART